MNYQEDFPSTPSAIFGHKGLTGDEAQTQKSNPSSTTSSPRREKPAASSTTETDQAEGKDELDDVLDDIDQSMSNLYVAEDGADENTTTETPFTATPNQQSPTSSTQNYPQQYANNVNVQGYGYAPYQQPQPFMMQQGDASGQGQVQYTNYPQDMGFQQQQQQGVYPQQMPQQGQMQQMQPQGMANAGYAMAGRGQIANNGQMHLQQGVFDLSNGQATVVNPGMTMGMDQQAGYYHVLPNGAQQPMYMDPYGRMNVPNSGAYPQMQPEVAYSNATTGEGMSFVQYGQPPNAVGSYWAPQGAVPMTDPAQMQQQNMMMQQQRGQPGRGGMYMSQDQQFNNGMPQMNQQMNMIPMNGGGRNGNGMMPHPNGYAVQNVPGGYNGPNSPSRGPANMQTPLSPSKGSQHDDNYRQDGNGDMLDNYGANNGGRRGYNNGRGGSTGNNVRGGSPINNSSMSTSNGGVSGGAAANAAAVSRDPVVEDFRNTYGKGREWEIRDLIGHVVAFCQDQHGSRFIQQRLEVASDPDKQIVFDEVLPSAHSLMTDVFGNYVIQKLFEFGRPDQCETLAALLMGQAVPLALQMYGCRVIQKALEYVATKRLVALVGEFEGQQVLRCVHDQNGNHVIQKCIEVVSRVAKESQPELTEYLSSRIQFIIQAFSGRVRELSMHPYGCRVVQRILEHCTNTQKAPVLDELRKCCRELIQDQYGNYVIQHVMQHGWETDKAILIEEVQSRLLEYSQHKFASNVVEKCIQYADKKDRDQMIWTIINVTFDLNNPVDAKTGQCVLENMVRDPYANYVVQKVIDVSDAGQRGAIIRYMRENIVQLRRYTYGKHIIIRLEKVSGEKF